MVSNKSAKKMRILLVLFFGISISLSGNNYEDKKGVKNDFLEEEINKNLQDTERRNEDLLRKIELKLLKEYELVPKTEEMDSNLLP